MSRTRKEKAKLAGRILLAGATGGQSEVARAKGKLVGKAVDGISNSMAKGRARRQARRAKRRAGNFAGGEQIGNKTSFTQPRKNLNQGGQPQYKSGDMPKAKPC